MNHPTISDDTWDLLIGCSLIVAGIAIVAALYRGGRGR